MNHIEKSDTLTRALHTYRAAERDSEAAYAAHPLDPSRIVAAGERLAHARAALCFVVDQDERSTVVRSLSDGLLAQMRAIQEDGLRWPREHCYLEDLGLVERTDTSLAIEHNGDRGRLVLTKFGRDALNARPVAA